MKPTPELEKLTLTPTSPPPTTNLGDVLEAAVNGGTQAQQPALPEKKGGKKGPKEPVKPSLKALVAASVAKPAEGETVALPQQEECFDFVAPVLGDDADPKKLQENAKKVEAAMAAAVAFMFSPLKAIADAEATGDEIAVQSVKQTSGAVIAAAEEQIDKALARTGVYLTAAALGFLDAILTMAWSSSKQIKDLIHGPKGLIKRGLLVPVDNREQDRTTVRVGYGLFQFPAKLGFLPGQVRRLTAAANKLTRLSDRLEAQRRSAALTRITSEVNITAKQAIMEAADGKCCIAVPTEFYLAKDTDDHGNVIVVDGKPKMVWRRRGGGNLFLEFSGNAVFPLKGVGSLEAAIDEMVKLEVRLGRKALTGWKFEEVDRKKLDLADTIKAKLRCPYPDARKRADKAAKLWYMFHRAWVAAIDAEKRAEEIRLMQGVSELSPVEFFGLNGKSQDDLLNKPCLLHLDGIVTSEDVVNPGLLVKWVPAEDGKRELEVMEIASNLKPVLAEFEGKRFPATVTMASHRLGWYLDKIRWQTKVTHEATTPEQPEDDAEMATDDVA